MRIETGTVFGRGTRMLAAVALAGVTACSDDATEDGCYEIDPMLEYTPPFIPRCAWRPGELPEPCRGV